ncbi:hypothetical protein TeGR_g2187 [Tetraparma gracilis]|uniref:Transmembrane protein n=1 Tax=Tetraparma gracilis TaxID=2962635 RepID=A0ABQ6N687_9STRA|nr:hypothetical protein TeGR_g2187 [Tetraparma gracilis]
MRPCVPHILLLLVWAAHAAARCPAAPASSAPPPAALALGILTSSLPESAVRRFQVPPSAVLTPLSVSGSLMIASHGGDFVPLSPGLLSSMKSGLGLSGAFFLCCRQGAGAEPCAVVGEVAPLGAPAGAGRGPARAEAAEVVAEDGAGKPVRDATGLYLLLASIFAVAGMLAWVWKKEEDTAGVGERQHALEFLRDREDYAGHAGEFAGAGSKND